MKQLALIALFIVLLMIMELAYGQDQVSITVTDNLHYIDVTQTGSANHTADINLSGAPSGIELTQSGSTEQNFSIISNCVNPAGCGVIVIQQGF